ncbi:MULTISPECIES: LutC/YkgG family protein [Mycobacteriales]|uniref:L-lactate dehydrogenase complex protein LldG n=1 Tax=Hoyosella altamirensis TaxID=616997 RepID=A0A839RK42_9ACTN|nr:MULTISPECIES: LUD domain-containing protein [Mycobacteriales]MBB3036544.1 L-lactate dehydrogenase complex protein LldG [Hoyosella altamirensis]MCT2028668.1 LUD domain-containing protein [Dietzia cinnamea]MCW4352578.1 LUD domain-containing protein [Hoyosella sp. YIM 151337]
MSTDAKTEILARIRGALADQPTAPTVERIYRTVSDRPAAEVLEMLEDRLVDYKATVHHENVETLPARITELLGSSARYVVPAGLDPSWLPADTDTLQMIRESTDERGQVLGVRELNAVDAVVTSSTVSCAETGTIFLTARPDEGRRAISLVPDHHICVVPAASVVELIPEALSRVEPIAPITMISGPSATSDIELERVEGVHGPRRLDVILLG